MSRQVVAPPGVTPAAPFSLGIKAGDFLFVSGQTAREGGVGRIPEGIREQTRVCLENGCRRHRRVLTSTTSSTAG